MTRGIRKLVTMLGATALALGAGVGLAVPAQAATTVAVPGCYGVAPHIYCQITLYAEVPVGVSTAGSTTRVCVVICADVPTVVPILTLDNPAGGICVTATDESGNENVRERLDVAVVVGSCGDGLGYRLMLVDATAIGCEPFVPGVPKVVICAGQGGFYYHDEVTHLTIGTPASASGTRRTRTASVSCRTRRHVTVRFRKRLHVRAVAGGGERFADLS